MKIRGISCKFKFKVEVPSLTKIDTKRRVRLLPFCRKTFLRAPPPMTTTIVEGSAVTVSLTF